MSLRVAVFASGGGSNLQALLDRLNEAGVAWGRIALVISDRGEAGALKRARDAGVPAVTVAAAGRASEAVAEETLALLERHRIDLIALAGYLRLIPSDVVDRFRGRIVNIHPALLPAFGGKGMYGMHVHRAVLAAGCRVSGVTVHHVDERYDEGRAIAQWPVPVLGGDTPERLAARVLHVEHRLYPLALERLAKELAGEGVSATPEGCFDWRAAAPDEVAMRLALGLE